MSAGSVAISASSEALGASVYSKSAAAATLSSPAGSHATRSTSGLLPSPVRSRLAVRSVMRAWMSAKYADHRPPRSGMSTRRKKAGMILRSSARMAAAHSRASARGCANMRRSIISYAWPEA